MPPEDATWWVDDSQEVSAPAGVPYLSNGVANVGGNVLIKGYQIVDLLGYSTAPNGKNWSTTEYQMAKMIYLLYAFMGAYKFTEAIALPNVSQYVTGGGTMTIANAQFGLA